MALFTAMAFVGAPTASATKNIKVTICHATSSHSNPYVQETVSGSSIDEVQNRIWNGHGDHTGPVYVETDPLMEDWGDIIPAFGTFPGINTDASVEGCAKGVEETFDAEQPYCAVTDGTYEARTATVPDTFRSQELADEALVEDLTDLATDEPGTIIPPYKDLYAGNSWTEANQVIFDAGCRTVPLYAGTATYPNVNVCYGPNVIEVGPIAPAYGTEAIYTDQTVANNEAKAYVNDHIKGATVAFMAAHPEYAPVPADGICVRTPPTPPTEPVAPVTVEEPEAVAVAAPATIPTPTKVVLPATIPAGDGSSIPTVPVAVLALVALVATTLAVSTVRLARSRR